MDLKKNWTDFKLQNTWEKDKNIEAGVYCNYKKCDWVYTYTYTPINKIKTVQQK